MKKEKKTNLYFFSVSNVSQVHEYLHKYSQFSDKNTWNIFPADIILREYLSVRGAKFESIDL